MVAKKTAKKATRTAAAASPRTPAGLGSSTTEAVRTKRLLRRLLEKLPPLQPAARAALRSLATDAERSRLGAATKGDKLLVEGVAAAATIDSALGSFPALAEAYTPARFAYFLEALLALEALVAAGGARAAKRGAAAGVVRPGREAALALHAKLVRRLARAAGRRPVEAKAVEALPSVGTTNDELRRAIASASALADAWLGPDAGIMATLAAAAGLDTAVVEAVRAAAESLGDGAHAAGVVFREAPVQRLEEGSVVLEIAHAIDVLEEAYAENDAVPRLAPGPATRHLLAAEGPVREAPTAPKPRANGALPHGSR